MVAVVVGRGPCSSKEDKRRLTAAEADDVCFSAICSAVEPRHPGRKLQHDPHVMHNLGLQPSHINL